MTRCRQAVGERVERDARVQVGAFPGQTVRSVSEKAKDKLREVKQGQSPAMTAGGLNDVLRGNGPSTGKRVTKGIEDLKATYHNVRMAACTVLEVQRKGGHVEWAVVAANKEIWRLGSQLNLGVVDINREVRAEGYKGSL